MKKIVVCAVCLLLVFSISCGLRQSTVENSDMAEDVQKKDLPDEASLSYENAEIEAETKEQILISRDGEIFELGMSENDALVHDIRDLVWFAMRERLGSEQILQEISVGENPYIAESDSFLKNGNDTVDAERIWVRIVREKVEEAATLPIGYKDICAYVEGEDACVAVQRVEGGESWDVWKFPGYGDWLDKSLLIYLSVCTGLY